MITQQRALNTSRIKESFPNKAKESYAVGRFEVWYYSSVMYGTSYI